MIDPLKAKISAAMEAAIAKNLDMFKTHVGPKAVALLNDDAMVASIAEKLYPVLPMPIRFVVKQDAFETFMLGNRRYLISALGGTLPAEEIALPAQDPPRLTHQE